VLFVSLHSFPFLQNSPPALGQAPDLMTNPQMAALVVPIDAAVLFPFYAEVNINTAKFRWYKTGQLDTKSKSFYAVPVLCCLLPVLSQHLVPFSPSAVAPATLLTGVVTAHILELPGGQEKRPRASFAGTRTSTSESVAG